MKKLKWLILVMCLVLGLSVFAACGGNNDGTDKTVEATGISLAPTRALEVGQSSVLAAMVDPWDANAEITWKSSDTAVATVSTEGQAYGVAKVTAVAAGEVDVTATVSGKTATCKVTVTEHITPYWFLAGQSSAAYFNWNNYSRQDDITVARVLKPVEGSNEKVFTTTIDLFAGDMFKLAKLTNVSTDNHWDDQVGGNDKDEELADADITLVATTEETALSTRHKTGSDGDPKNYKVSAEGKYEIKLDLTDDNYVVSYKRVGDTDPVAWKYDVVFHGNWSGVADDWTGIKFGTVTFDEDNLTATADIELTAAPFGVKTTPAGTMDQVGWFNSDKMELADGVTTITLAAGANATCTAAGTYNVTVTLNTDGSIAKILFNSFTAAE